MNRILLNYWTFPLILIHQNSETDPKPETLMKSGLLNFVVLASVSDRDRVASRRKAYPKDSPVGYFELV